MAFFIDEHKKKSGAGVIPGFFIFLKIFFLFACHSYLCSIYFLFPSYYLSITFLSSNYFLPIL